MGRELKRVPLDFDWPLNQAWKGYLNPYHSFECKSCDGSGLNPETKKLSDDWYSFDKTAWIDLGNGRRYNNLAWQYHLTEVEITELVKAGRLSNLMEYKCYFDKKQNKWFAWIDDTKKEVGEPEYPTPEQVNEWAKSGFGHDSINQWICVKARAQKLGIYGKCEYCNGEGVLWKSEEIKKLHEDWKPFEPPIGEGYQLWQTTSESSPISPVFEVLDDLCTWAEDNATIFGSSKLSKEEWTKMFTSESICYKEGNMVFI